MLTRLLRAVLPPILICTFGVRTAEADIYRWIGADGVVTYSDESPPKGIQAEVVVTERAAPRSTQSDAAAASARRDAELQALSERIRELERAAIARSQVPAGMPYQEAPYPPASPPDSGYSCDPARLDCPPWYAPTGIVVVTPPAFGRFVPFRRRAQGSFVRPMRAGGGFRRR